MCVTCIQCDRRMILLHICEALIFEQLWTHIVSIQFSGVVSKDTNTLPKLSLKAVTDSAMIKGSIRGLGSDLYLWLKLKELSFSLKGVPNLQKVGVNKIAIPHFGNKNFMTLHHRYTLPPKKAKIVLKSIFLNKISTLSVVTLWLPTFWSSKILWSPYFSKNLWPPPQYIWDLLFGRKW